MPISCSTTYACTARLHVEECNGKAVRVSREWPPGAEQYRMSDVLSTLLICL